MSFTLIGWDEIDRCSAQFALDLIVREHGCNVRTGRCIICTREMWPCAVVLLSRKVA